MTHTKQWSVELRTTLGDMGPIFVDEEVLETINLATREGWGITFWGEDGVSRSLPSGTILSTEARPA